MNNNIENIFSDRRKKESQQRLTYSKYIFNSHLIMFLIIVFGAIIINYSTWLEAASSFELHAVYIATSAIFSYLLVSTRVKTFLKEADSVFLLPLEKYYSKVAIKTAITSGVSQLIVFALFVLALSPIINKIGEIHIFGIFGVAIAVFVSVFARLLEVLYFGESTLLKLLLFLNFFLQILTMALTNIYLEVAAIVVCLSLLAFIVRNNIIRKKNGGNLLRWNEAAEYDKHRNENYLKFVNMFVDVPLSGIKVSRRKYFDILLPKLSKKNFNKGNSFKYYYYRVFLRQENTVFLALRLMLISALIIYSFDNIYVDAAVIVAYSYLTIIQLVPLYKQISTNIWHSILPVSEELKVKSFKSLLNVVMIVTTFILTLFSIIITSVSTTSIVFNLGSFVVANLLARIFVAKVK